MLTGQDTIDDVNATTRLKGPRREASMSPSETPSKEINSFLSYAREANEARTRNTSELCDATRRFAVPLRNLAPSAQRTHPCAPCNTAGRP